MDISEEEAYSGSSADSTAEESGEEPARKRRRDNEDNEDDLEEASLPSLLHPRDVANFLKLSEALRILLSGRLTEEDLAKADKLIREYCTELLEVRLHTFPPYNVMITYTTSSYTGHQSSNPITTTQRIRFLSFVTMGRSIVTGRFCSSE